MVTSHQVHDMFPTIRLPWQRQLPSNGAMNILQLWASEGQMRESILIKFGTQQHVRTRMIVTWSNINFFFKFKMAHGRHVGKYSKCHNSRTNGPTETQLGWSHPIMFPTCPRHVPHYSVAMATAVATAHWTFCSYGRLEAERVNQFWWNLVHNSKLRPQ